MRFVSYLIKELAKIVRKEKITSLALPRLATGVGGLEWVDVKPIIYERLSDLKIPVYIYTKYVKGMKAVEK